MLKYIINSRDLKLMSYVRFPAGGKSYHGYHNLVTLRAMLHKYHIYLCQSEDKNQTCILITSASPGGSISCGFGL